MASYFAEKTGGKVLEMYSRYLYWMYVDIVRPIITYVAVILELRIELPTAKKTLANV